MKIKDFNKNIKLSETKGLSILFYKDAEVYLNKFGYYEEIIKNDLNNEIKSELINSYTLFNSNKLSNLTKDLFDKNLNHKFDSRLGFYFSLFAGYAKEGNYREKGSSGGLTTWLASELFSKKLITHLIHVKKSDGDVLFEYGISKSIEDIKENSKTRYYPVELSGVLKYIIENEGKYAIVGIPDIVSSLRLLCKINPEINLRLKFFIGLICGHQKSTKFLESMVRESNINMDDVTDFDFRHKILTNTAGNYGIKVTTKTKEFILDKKRLFGQNWGLGLFKLPSSDFTDDVFNEFSDVTFGDAWLEKYENDPKGTNVIIIRNKIIEEIIVTAFNEKRIYIEQLSSEEVFKSQESHYLHTYKELAYRLFLRKKSSRWLPIKRIDPSNKFKLSRKIIQLYRLLLSKKSHEIYYKERYKSINQFIKKMSFFTKQYNFVYKLIYYYTLIRKRSLLSIFKSFFKRIFRTFK